MDLYRRVRRAHFVEGMSIREAARVFGLRRSTVNKMLEYSAPPGYRREHPPRRPKLDPHKGVIDRILEDDQLLPKKQRHTARRIFDRLTDEHGFLGKYTIVKDYVRERRRQTREMFLPLAHSPGHAQADPSASSGQTSAKPGWSSVERSRKPTTWPWISLTTMRAT